MRKAGLLSSKARVCYRHLCGPCPKSTKGAQKMLKKTKLLLLYASTVRLKETKGGTMTTANWKTGLKNHTS